VASALELRERSLMRALRGRSRLERQLGERAEALTQALAAQARSEERFRVLAEGAPLGVYLTDAAGKCLYTNPAWQQIYGLSLDESLHGGWSQTLYPEDKAVVVAAWQRTADSGEPFQLGFRIRRPEQAGGGVRHVYSRSQALRDGRGQLIGHVGCTEDVTERLAAERALAESRSLLDRTGRIAGVGGWSLEFANEEVVWSDQTCRIHDLEPGHRATLAQTLGAYAPEGRAAMETAVHRARHSGEGWDLELPLITARGRRLWVRTSGEVDLLDGRPTRLHGALQDITEQRLARDELERSRQRLRVLYESTPAMLHSVTPEGVLLTVSDVWLQRLGFRRDDVIGRRLDELFTAESAAQLQAQHRPELWRLGRVHDRPAQMRAGDGSLRHVLISAVAEYDTQGRPLRALAYVDDITEDLRRQAELASEQRLRRELEQLLRERSEMLDVLAHEVRQPLNNASAALQSAAHTLAGADQRQALERLSRAEAVLGQVLAGVDNTLAAASLLAGNGSLAQHDTDIDTLIAVSIADLPRERRHRVRVDRDAASRTAVMDMSLMRLALRNLLSNALKYSPADSPVTLRVVESDDPLALFFEVADAGAGFAADVLPRLFERGSRGGGALEGGHGLGLYIVRRVMQLHGGDVALMSTGRRGSVLKLTLPQSGM
jgi:PAS domain S-box-containing protein